jgi:hypothetical protein
MNFIHLLILLAMAVGVPFLFYQINYITTGSGYKPNKRYYYVFAALTGLTALVSFFVIKPFGYQLVAVAAIAFAIKYIIQVIQKNQANTPNAQSKAALAYGTTYRPGSLGASEAKANIYLKIGGFVVAAIIAYLLYFSGTFLNGAVIKEGAFMHIIGGVFLIAAPISLLLCIDEIINPSWAPELYFGFLFLAIQFSIGWQYAYNFYVQ